MSAWSSTLDALAAHLDGQRTLLDAGRAGDITAFRPPEGLGPLPKSLVSRAVDLLAASRALEAEVVARTASINAELGELRVPGGGSVVVDRLL